MKLRSLLGVFVAALVAFPLHAQSQTHDPDGRDGGMLSRIFERLAEIGPESQPSILSQVFDRLEEVRDTALEVATQGLDAADGPRDEQG